MHEGDGQHKANSHLNDYDEEIFDDGDFYQQLLREVIETGSNGNKLDCKY